MDDLFDFKMLSLNAKGLGEKKKRVAVFRWLKKKADIVFLQETHFTSKDEMIYRNEWGVGDIYYAHGKSNSRGVAILLNKSCDIEVTDIIHASPDGRTFIMEVKIQDVLFKLVNIYSPNKDGEQKAFYNQLNAIFKKYNFNYSDNIILGGDFNVVFNPKLDKKGGSDKIKSDLISIIDNIICKLDLQDVWRVKHPDKKGIPGGKRIPKFSVD